MYFYWLQRKICKESCSQFSPQVSKLKFLWNFNHRKMLHIFVIFIEFSQNLKLKGTYNFSYFWWYFVSFSHFFGKLLRNSKNYFLNTPTQVFPINNHPSFWRSLPYSLLFRVPINISGRHCVELLCRHAEQIKSQIMI